MYHWANKVEHSKHTTKAYQYPIAGCIAVHRLRTASFSNNYYPGGWVNNALD